MTKCKMYVEDKKYHIWMCETHNKKWINLGNIAPPICPFIVFREENIMIDKKGNKIFRCLYCGKVGGHLSFDELFCFPECWDKGCERS